jgi:RimJ/RimL family protein N-acetyltransferase
MYTDAKTIHLAKHWRHRKSRQSRRWQLTLQIDQEVNLLDYVYGQDKLVADFAATLIPAVRERGFPASKAIGVIEDGKLIAGMVYHNFDPAAGVIEMSGAAIPGKYWLTPETLRRIYDYPFLEIGCQMVLMRVPEENRMLLRVLASIGYAFILVPRLLGHNKNCVLCTLTFEDWSSNKFNSRDQRRFAAQKEEAA